MLCSIDYFSFESDGVNLTTIKEKITYDFDKSKLINAPDDWQSSGDFSQTLTLSGSLIKKSNRVLSGLKSIASAKKEVTLAFDDGRAASVLILEIETDKSLFLNNGSFLKQDFEVMLGVISGSI